MKDPREIFKKLIKTRIDLDVDEGTYDFTNAPISEKLKGDGIEVSANEIERIEGYAGNSPYLSYEGNLVILHISDTQKPKDYLSNNELIRDGKDKQPKFHFSACSTLKKMLAKGRYDRYVYSRKESGLFKVQAREMNGKQHQLDDIKLYVCRNCLRKTNYHQYKEIPKKQKEQKTKIVKEFNIGEFLEEIEGAYAPITRLPRYAENTAPSNVYTKDWGEISTRTREKAGWRCSVCEVDMHQKKSGLHVHHKNRHKHDNSRGNLQVLCCLCHKKEHPVTMGCCPKDVSDFIHSNRPSADPA